MYYKLYIDEATVKDIVKSRLLSGTFNPALLNRKRSYPATTVVVAILLLGKMKI